MPFCTNCGQEIQAGAKFCENCGTPTTMFITKAQKERLFMQVKYINAQIVERSLILLFLFVLAVDSKLTVSKLVRYCRIL